MHRSSIRLLACSAMFAAGCREPKPPASSPAVNVIDSTPAPSGTVADTLVGLMRDRIDLDTFTRELSRQHNVRVVARLAQTQSADGLDHTYADSAYRFGLHLAEVPSDGPAPLRATFIDGHHLLRFSDHRPICISDSSYQCESYGFDANNSLIAPVVLEVCGKRFLYSDVSYWCNGIGCGCVLTFIYDLEAHRGVFLETFRNRVAGYEITDLDADGKPDLLVMAQRSNRMDAFDADEVRVKLVGYDWNGGRPVPKRRRSTGIVSAVELYTILPSAGHYWHGGGAYARVSDQWLGEAQ